MLKVIDTVDLDYRKRQDIDMTGSLPGDVLPLIKHWNSRKKKYPREPILENMTKGPPCRAQVPEISQYKESKLTFLLTFQTLATSSSLQDLE